MNYQVASKRIVTFAVFPFIGWRPGQKQYAKHQFFRLAALCRSDLVTAKYQCQCPTNYEIRFRRMIESRYAMQVTKETLLIDPTNYHSASSVDK